MNTLPFFKYIGSQWENATRSLTDDEIGKYMRLFNDALSTGGYILKGFKRADFDGILLKLGINESDAPGREKMHQMFEKFTKLGLLDGSDPTDENPKGYYVPPILEGFEEMIKIHNAKVKGGQSRWKNSKIQNDKTVNEEKNSENSAKNEKESIPANQMPKSEAEAINMMKDVDIPEGFVEMAWCQLKSKGFRNQGDDVGDFIQYVQSYWNCYLSKHPDAYERWRKNFPYDSEEYDLGNCSL